MDKNKILSLDHLKVILSAIKNISLSSFKNDLKQQDWEQHNENEPNFIKNKTHYDSREFAKATEDVHYGGHVSIEDYSDVSDELYNYLLYEDVDDITVDGFPITFSGRYTGYVYYGYRNSNNNACSVIVSISEPNKVYVMNLAWSDGWYNNRTVQITYNKSVKGELKQIDNKYISSEIVRDRDLDLINSKLNDCVKYSDYATTSKAGIAKANASYGIQMEGQNLAISPASASDVSAKTNQYKPIVPKYVDYAVQAGLGNSSLTWTETQKTKARSVIGAIGTDDVLQSDWSQENESATDYIKNKPFYDYRKSISSIGANDYLEANLEAGKTYTVSINGVLYTDLLCTEYYWYQNGGATVRILGGTTMDSTTSWKYDFVLYTFTTNNIVRAVCKNTNNFNFPEWTSAYSTGRNVSKSDNVIILDNELTPKQLDEKYIPDNIPKIATATIGQTLEVESVDEDGKPTKWKAVNKPSGGGGIDKAYVESVKQTTTSTASGGENIVTVTNSDGSTNTIKILNGIDGEDGRDGQTPFIDENGYFTYGDPSGAISRTLLGEVYVTGHRKIQPLAIDYATGIITVDDCSFLPSDQVAYTKYRVCIRKNTDAFYPNNVIPSELYGGIGIKKISDTTLYLYKTTTKIESYAESASIDLDAWYVEYSDTACSGITVNLTDVQYGNHLYVEVYSPCTEVKTTTGLNTNVYDSSNIKYLSNGATDGIRPASADVYTFDSVRSLYVSSVKGNAMPLKYTYDFIIDENYIYVTGKNIVACATADDKVPIYNITEKAFLLKNNGLSKININQGSQYIMFPEGSYLKVWEVHD